MYSKVTWIGGLKILEDVKRNLEERRELARRGGGEKRIAAQHAKGKLTARERIDLLLDDDSFEEFDMFVKHRSTEFGMQNDRPSGDGVVTGHGTGRKGIALLKLWTSDVAIVLTQIQLCAQSANATLFAGSVTTRMPNSGHINPGIIITQVSVSSICKIFDWER